MEEAQMIINIANKALIYTAFCSWVSANTASQYLSIKSHGERQPLWVQEKQRIKERKKTEEAFVCIPLIASIMALNS